MASDDPHLISHWPRAALLTIDVQQDLLSDSLHGIAGTTEVIPALRRLTDAFRATTRPIVHMVRLYQPGGSNADRVRRSLLANGASIEVFSLGFRAQFEGCARRARLPTADLEKRASVGKRVVSPW